MYTTPRKVKQESRLRRSMSLTNNNNGNNRMNSVTDSYEDDSNPIPSTTSPYYTLSNRPSHNQHHHLNGIAELPVSVSGLPQQSSSFSDPFSNLSTKGIPIDLQQQYAGGGSRTRFSYSTSPNGTQIIIPDVIDISQQQAADGTSLDFRQNHHQKQYSYSGPPPYRNPPRTLPGTDSSTNGQIQPCSQSVPDSPVDSTYHTHSAKFPLTLDSETAKEIQHQLAAHHNQQQKQKSLSSGTSTIKRSGSAFELERLIEAFNQEQHALVMSSLQQGILPKRRLDGIDNPGLDLGHHTTNSSSPLQNGHPLQNGGTSQNPQSFSGGSSPAGGKMAGYTFSDSSTSQSLSLSSSNTDSLDTVIYKGPNAAAPSVRDWQRSKDSLQTDFGHRADAVTGSYRSDAQGMFDNRSYPMQQASAASSSSYQPMQFNGPGAGGNVVMNSGQTPSSVMASNGYSMEYRHQQQVQQQQQQQQQQHHQNLSVHSVHQSQQLHQQQNGGVMMRQPNGTSSSQQSHFGSNSAGMVAQSPMLPTKSPMVTHKPLHPPPGPSPSSSSNQSVPNSVGGGGGGGSVPSSNLKSNLNGGGGGDSSSVGLDKAKDSTKMFPTKTYNHIKDMISSRFGNNSSSNSAGLPPKGLNNSNVVNNNANTSNNTTSSQNGNTNGGFTMNGQNGTHSYMESTSAMGMPTYGLTQHGHIHSHSIHDTFGGSPPVAAPYYTSPPAVSPQNGTGNVNGGVGVPNINGSANSYRSPPMNDRKNVNTSFRKAIHQSTLKSNLTEESLQLRPIMEVSNLNGSARDVYHRGMPQYSQNGEQGQPRYGLGHEPPSPSLIPHHVERAQRALDKLCEPGGPPFTRTGSGPMTHQNGISNRMVQQFSGSDEIASSTNNRMYSLNTKIGPISSASSGASQLTTGGGGGGELGAIPRNRFSVTPGPSSSTSNSSGGLGASALTTTSGGGAHTVESSLSSPSSSSYTHSSGSGGGGGSGIFNKQSLAHQQHQAPTTSLLNGNSKSGSNNKSSTNNDQIPPPLPTSQKPEVSGASGHSPHHLHFQNSNNSSSNSNNHHNTLGLPPVLPSVLVGEKRENGDGSSGTMENPSSANLHLVESTSSSPSSKGAICSSSSSPSGATGPSGGSTSNASSSALAVNKSKSEQLKKITADLHNLAISVAAEQHFHHNHHHHLQFASGSGSGSGSAQPANNNQSSNNNHNSSSSECENKGSQRIGSGQSHTTSDSGVGTVMLTKSPLNSISDHETNCKSGGGGGSASSADLLLGGDDHNVMDSVSSGNDSEWVDIVEPEIRQILELEKKSKSGKPRLPGDKMTGVPNGSLATSTPAHIAQVHHGKGAQSGKNGEQVDLMGDITASPILPHHHRLMSGSPTQSPKVPKKFDLTAYNKKAGHNRSQELLAVPSTSAGAQNGPSTSSTKVKSPRSVAKVNRSNSGAQRYGRASRGDKGGKNANAAAHRLIKDLGLKGIKLSRHAASQILYPQDDNGDMTSTTTGLDLESMLDGQTEQTSDDDDDMSTTIDTTDAHAIRRQLESLESMYTEVLKVLGAKRFPGNRYPTNDLRNAKRRPYGSMSSLPSSVSSRPFRERKIKLDDKKKVKDIKSINKRFQRLESHVVTLARSVAHLSSEMRTQHIMVQEIESIRNEMQQLRNQVVKSSMQNQSAAAAVAAQNFARVASGRNGAGVNMVSTTDWTSFRNALPSLTNPCRVRKLTKFFGDEPPLVRIFLKKLGYEKYASAFEQERIGIMELPYLTEERLNKMGIPMGPRLRILQEAQQCLRPGYQPNHDTHHTHHQSNTHGNLSVYVV